ncbi:MAG: bacillithiol system redox-active protein YtxJ [Rhodothermales bacterium]
MTANSDFRPLQTRADFELAMETSHLRPVVLFKHSNRCMTSALAYRRMEAGRRPDDPPVFLLIVQQTQALAREIADSLKVRHESPQIIVLREGSVLFHTSHASVSPEAVREVVAAQVR